MSREACTLAALLLLVSSVDALAQRPSTRPSRDQFTTRLRYEGRYSEADLARPASEIVQEFLQTDDRRVLEMYVRLLRRKVVKNEHIEQIIRAAQDPDASAKRIYYWQVLFDSGTPAAQGFLEKTFSEKNDEATLLTFLQQVELTNVGSVPLITRLFETNPSELVRGEIMRLATADPRPSMEGYAYADQQRIEACRATLLGWLLQHATSDAQKEKLLTGRSVPVSLADDVREALGTIKSPETRALIYKRLLRYPQEPWMSYLLTDEKDPAVQADVIRRVREDMELGTERGMGGEIPVSLRAAAANAAPPVKAEAQKLLEVARKRGIDQMFARFKQSASYQISRRDMGPSTDPRLQRPVEAEVDAAITSLKIQYGELPEEAQLRTRLKTELEGYRRQPEQPQTRPQ